MTITPNNPEDDAPADLRQAFKELGAPRVVVPSETDRAISEAARAHLAQPRRSWTIRFAPLAMAACVALTFTIALMWFKPGTSGDSDARASGGDILQAFALARDLDAGIQPAAMSDVNGDGMVSYLDVNALAQRATALPKVPREGAPMNKNGRFEAIAVFVHSDAPLAAYQFRFGTRANSGAIKIVGVEDGDSVFKGRPPYFDRAAVEQGNAEQVVVAMLNTAKTNELPTGRTRVATIHVWVDDAEPEYDVRLEVAAGAGGQKISAEISIQKGTP